MGCSPYLSRVAEAVESGRHREVALVMPSALLAARARAELLHMLPSQTGFGIPIYEFDQFVLRLVARAGSRLAVRRRGLGDFQQEIVVGRLLVRAAEAGRLKRFGNAAMRPGLARAICSLIDEMKMALATPDSLQRALPGQSPRAPMQIDFVEVWRDYESFLARAGCGRSEDGCLDLVHALEQDPCWVLGDLKSVWFEHLANPTPASALVVKSIAHAVDECEVNLPYECSRQEVSSAVSRARVLLGDVPVVAKQAGNYPRERSSLRIITAPGPSQEAREAAREIKALICREGFRPADICVVTADTREFRPEFLAALSEFEVPCSTRDARPLASSPLVADCLALAEAMTAQRSGFDLVALFSSPYVGLGPSAGADLLRSLGVRGLSLPLARWKARLSSSPGCDQAAEYWSCLSRAWSGRGEGDSLRRHVQDFRSILSELGMPRALFSRDNLAFAVQAWAAWSGFDTALSRIEEASEVLGEAEGGATWADFVTILSSEIGRDAFMLERGDSAGVAVTDWSSMAGLSFPVVFLCGMLEGVFPRRMRRPWIFTEADMAHLADRGIDAPAPGRFAENERFLFRMGVGAAEKRLYITYPSSSSDGAAVRRSFFVDELLEEAGVAHDMEGAVSRRLSPADLFPEEWELTASQRELELCALWRLARGMSDPGVEAWAATRPEDLKLAMVWFSRRKRADALEFTEYDGRLCEQALLSWHSSEWGLDRVWPVSGFDDYGRCPFLFFCRRILALKAPDGAEPELPAMEGGTARHEILRRFFQGLKGTVDSERGEEYADTIRGITADVFAGINRENTAAPPGAWKAYEDAIADQMARVARAEAKFAEDTGGMWSPAYLEWGFGPGSFDRPADSSVEAPLMLTAAGPLVSGRIDRIDRGPDGALALYDYKTDHCPEGRDVANMVNMQMAIYMLAASEFLASKEGKVAGGSYYSIASADVKSGLWIRDFADFLRAGRKGHGRLDEQSLHEFLCSARERAFEIARAVASGQFLVYPSSCGLDRCPYIRICRYDRDVAFAKVGRAPDADECGRGAHDSEQETPFGGDAQ